MAVDRLIFFLLGLDFLLYSGAEFGCFCFPNNGSTFNMEYSFSGFYVFCQSSNLDYGHTTPDHTRFCQKVYRVKKMSNILGEKRNFTY